MADGNDSDRDGESDDGGGQITGACIPIPGGMYEIAYLSYKTANYFGQPKVVVHFSIINHDTYAGTEVDRFYNATSLTGPPRRYGQYKAACRGQLVREYHRLIGEPIRRDRISFAVLKGRRVLAQIKTVTHDYRHQPIPIEEQYSSVSKLIQILDDEY